MPETQPNNFARVNPDGTVTAVFPGGVEIAADASSAPLNERKVRWVRDTDGALIAQLDGFYSTSGAAGLNGLDLLVNGTADVPSARTTLRAESTDGTDGRAEVYATEERGGRTTKSAVNGLTQTWKVPTPNDLNDFRIMESPGWFSRFLQWGPAEPDAIGGTEQHVSVAAGSASCVWGGALRTSAVLVVTHGMHLVSQGVSRQLGQFAMGLAPRDPNYSFAVPTGVVDTTFPIQGNRIDGTIPALNTTIACLWILLAWG